MRSWTVNPPNIEITGLENHSLRIFDSKTQRINLIPKQAEPIQIYVCGITPYDSAHLGHAFTYLAFDLMIRAMRVTKQNVNYVQNVTDIDDPLFERSRKIDKKWTNIVDDQLEIYRKDMQALNIMAPDHFVGVVENIDTINDEIENTIKRKFTYQLGTKWYFQTRKDNKSLLVKDVEDHELITLANERGCDTDTPGKLNAIDPIVWKESKEDEPSWNREFGTGRPGWHIQCISLANKYAKLPLHIQGGGKDLIFPHHAMCEEQAMALGLGDLATNYCHVGMVSYQGSKMSKSKGNLVFVHELINKGISPMVIRTCLMLNHWQSDWEFQEVDIIKAEKLLEKIITNLTGKYFSRNEFDFILESMLNNIQTPKILEFLSELDPDKNDEKFVPIDTVLSALLGLDLESV
jgi:L-cysteine:1D-myo-inositol 2-amino-2-deoxy-alpha-D-glucopyranoside ligase